jgi:hypothetical protein
VIEEPALCRAAFPAGVVSLSDELSIPADKIMELEPVRRPPLNEMTIVQGCQRRPGFLEADTNNDGSGTRGKVGARIHRKSAEELLVGVV